MLRLCVSNPQESNVKAVCFESLVQQCYGCVFLILRRAMLRL